MGDLHAQIHECTSPGLPSARDRLAGMIEAATTLSPAAKSAALARLAELPAGDTICHGDFHPDNIVLAPRGPVVLDWANAVRGDPIADVARTVLLLQIGSLPPGMATRLAMAPLRGILLRRYLRRYWRARSRDPAAGMAAVARWMLPVAAARACEDIEDERERLRALIARACRT